MSQSFPFLPDHSHLNEVRYEKVAALRAAGRNPYPAFFDCTHLAADILANEADYIDQPGKVVRIMGRVGPIRAFGKSAFFHVTDRSGSIQIFINKKNTDEESFETYKQFLDTGDLVGVTGTLFRTKTGETTVEAANLALLCKNTRPLPEKWHGLTDKEVRYRQRYVDLIVNPEVMETFKVRSRLVSAMRRFLDGNDFMEVETPMMQPLYGGAAARPFVTHHNTLDMDLYLRIAPELYLKRLVVGGMHRVYEINRNFRNEGISTQHNPEFTMLELYAGGWNASLLMDFVEELLTEPIRAALGTTVITLGGAEFDLARRPWPRISIIGALAKFCGIDVNWSMSLGEVKKAANGLHVPDEISTPVDAIVHLFEENVEQHLVEPTFITEFPKAISPLAKSKDDDPEVTDRFELYANCMEIANGFSELNDPAEQYGRFAEQVERRKAGDAEAVGVIDEDYVRALEYGMPPTAGLGVGIDRYAMLATGSASIRDVILFPLMRPDSGTTGSAAPSEDDASTTEQQPEKT
ncbi:MAG: lysyl-tRNA synthetase, class [Candidatus Sumerlaeota bacterium]|nr:lysyl-tRNA synthetase, class [Candidatus Sumerlaeota bacterium]